MISYWTGSTWAPVFATPEAQVRIFSEGRWHQLSPFAKILTEGTWQSFGGYFTALKVTGSLGCTASTADDSYLCHFLGFKCRLAPLNGGSWSTSEQQQIRETLNCSCSITADAPFDQLKVEPEATVKVLPEYAELSLYQEFDLGEEVLCTFSGKLWFTFPPLPYVYNWSSCTFLSEALYTHPMQHAGIHFNWNEG